MGNLKSCCKAPKDIDYSFPKSPKRSPIKSHNRNLSATFNVSIASNVSDRPAPHCIDVNTATEEQLMTLDGIDRTIAHFIVEYRKRLPGCKFQKIEDVALVSGVGADRFASFRDEICIKKPLENSKKSTKHSLNTSILSDLTTIPGVNEEIAGNIINYRKTKRFMSIEDLLKVEGIDGNLFNKISHHFTVKDENLKPPIPPRPSENYSNLSKDVQFGSNSSINNLLEFFLPLIKESKRPTITNYYTFENNNRPCIRIATWNLARLSTEKACNPGVLEVVCMTILEQGISVLCVQEIADKTALERIRDELNRPSLSHVKKFQSNSRKWDCLTSKASGRMYQSNEYLGVLYDTNMNITISASSLVEFDDDGVKLFVRKPFVVSLQINKLDVVLVILHLKAVSHDGSGSNRNEAEAKRTAYLLHSLENFLAGEKDLILLGDFNLESSAKQFDVLRRKGYTPLVNGNTFTNISTKNIEGSRSYDNIWIGQQTKKIHTGSVFVVRSGLTNALIPDVWSWGGVVSDHCPVYAEFYTDEDHDDTYITMKLDGMQIGDS
ncbi:DgyrCDS148 [Dimorphilus gyrociliatus]|uniref:DgyrCDS148 n=1 Tax=Dimorphilus gyrociliatus TaxID=2664684 RepID=A0A7I8V3Q9_9ANNE|nr:DgyrCDS148 [Dimorphilus gyrociliatus]